MTPVVRGPESGKTYACPECDSANQVVERAVDRQTAREGDERYACYDCGARFDDPTVRPVKGGTGGGGGPATYEHILAGMDPDDFPPGREAGR